MFNTSCAEGIDFREMVREAVKRLPVQPVVNGDAELRRVRVLGAEIEVNYRRCMLTMMLVPLPGEDAHSLPLRDFCVANVRRPFSLDDVERVLERQLRISVRQCDGGNTGQIGPVERGVLLQVARELVDLERINRETIAALDLSADVLAIAELVPRIEFKEIDGHWYSRVWQEIESLKELLLYAPNLLPLGYSGLVNGCLWGGSDILKEIKYELRKAGLSKNGWRDLVKLPRQTIDRLIPGLGERGELFENFAAAFLVYRLARAEGPSGFADHLADKEAGSLHELPAAAVQIMAREVGVRSATGRTQEFFDDDFTAVCLWLSGEEPRLSDLRKLGWVELVERARIYKSELSDQLGDDVPRNLTWVSALPEHEDGGYLFVPLTSSEALHEEGVVMKHCVEQYDVDCANGKSRIFSVRSVRSRQRLATVELHIDDLKLRRKWFVGQVRGFQKSNLCVKIENATKRLARRYTEHANLT